MAGKGNNCYVEIPINSMPLVGEADYGVAINPMIHCDRIAPFHVLILLLKGEMEIIEEGIPYVLKPGMVFFLKKGLHHWGEKPMAEGTTWYYAHFYTEEPPIDMPLYVFDNHKAMGVGLQELVRLKGNENQKYLRVPKQLTLYNPEPMKVKLEQLTEIHNQGNLLKSSILLWDILNDCVSLTNHEEENFLDERVEEVLIYLKSNYMRNFSADELAAEIGLSYKYLAGIFRNNTGKTIKEYQLFLRIRRAEELLSTSKLSMKEIASVIGFYDEFYFSRMFKKTKQVSPLAFRKTYIPRI